MARFLKELKQLKQLKPPKELDELKELEKARVRRTSSCERGACLTPVGANLAAGLVRSFTS